jgi:hypothetical protein
MNEATLNVIKADCARTTIEWGNGVLDAIFSFNGGFQKWFQECHRIHYLMGIVDNCDIVGGSLMCGNAVYSEANLIEILGKIEHYHGMFEDVDLSKYYAPDDTDPNPTPVPPFVVPTPVVVPSSADHYRAQTVDCVVGVNNVTFTTPLATADYELDATVIATNGMLQHNLIVTSRTANGFTVGDVIRAGRLSYFAVIRV